MRYLKVCALALLAATLSIPQLLASEVLVVTWQGKLSSEQAFEKRLKQLQPDVKFTYVDADRDRGNLIRTLNMIDLSRFKLVYSFGTVGTKIVQDRLAGKKPQVFNIVAAPVSSRIVNTMQKPGGNITGARLLIDLKTQLSFLPKVTDYYTLGVLYDTSEPHFKHAVQEINNILRSQGKQIREIGFNSNAQDIDAEIRNVVDKTRDLKAMFVLASFGLTEHNAKLQKALDSNLMVMSSISTYVETGSTLALGVEFDERGQSVAEQAARILAGEKAGNIPVSEVTAKNATLYVNKNKLPQSTLKKISELGMTVRMVKN